MLQSPVEESKTVLETVNKLIAWLLDFHLEHDPSLSMYYR